MLFAFMPLEVDDGKCIFIKSLPKIYVFNVVGNNTIFYKVISQDKTEIYQMFLHFIYL